MKSIDTLTTLKLAFCFYLFLGLALGIQGQAGEYYTYQDPNGKLVISNKEPPPGSKIIRQQNLTEGTDTQVQKTQERDDTQPSEQTEGSLKPPKNK